VAGQRRPRAATLEKRERLLDLTEDLMLREGYAAVTSRNVGALAEMPPSLLHYHFPTIDDLLVAVVRRRAEQSRARMEAALAAPQPLLAWWDLAADPRGTGLFVELLAAANHRPAMRDAVGGVARDLRTMQLARLHALLPEYTIDAEAITPALVAAAMQGLAFGVVQDEAAGYDTAPGEARAAMRRLLEGLEARRAEARR
jgi:AcrR family transcriptional regulator